MLELYPQSRVGMQRRRNPHHQRAAGDVFGSSVPRLASPRFSSSGAARRGIYGKRYPMYRAVGTRWEKIRLHETDFGTVVVNASTCDARYRAVNPAVDDQRYAALWRVIFRRAR
jgi:hypothetical protein